MNMMRKTVMAARIAAACALSASVCAEAADIPEGRYAYYDDGIYYNYDTFFCAGRGAFACDSINESALNSEEKKMLDNDGIYSDLILSRENGEYSIAGTIDLVKFGSLSTARKPVDEDKYIKQQCSYNTDAGLLKCMFYDTAEYETRGDEAGIFIIFSHNGNTLTVDNIDLRGNTDEMYVFRSNALNGAGFTLESNDEYLHSSYLSAKLEFAKSDGILNELWKSLDQKTRNKLKSNQRQWIKEKDSQCGKVTSKGTDAELIEMLKCQKGFTDIRIDMLRAIEY